jgi:hypothetical protein
VRAFYRVHAPMCRSLAVKDSLQPPLDTNQEQSGPTVSRNVTPAAVALTIAAPKLPGQSLD